jgi:MFS family permease
MSATRSAGGRRPGLALGLALIATAQLMVVLDATIVNVALPHIQRTLGFSGNGLEWVVNAYALSFGGLMLLGGRAGDLLGRRRVFISGLVAFSAASLAGGFASSQAWLLAARAIQGIGGALIAPTALALIATTFAEGPARNRAMSVVAAMSGGGRPGRRRPAHHLPVLALGAVRQRADRPADRGGRTARAARIGP